ncbi:hypothetical protein B0H17DRAFT_1216986 [Mycena rosella]|uniref:Uncharacterized protein n=1 Tax=Mycena rosella TaxID=1033263 RepID=A0AAD7C4P8_MYCRO|nr:hypothetical protein B0H17DRAFT_1216986 [Mycena rosella]
MVTSYYYGVCAGTVRHQAYFLHSGLAIHADSRVALQSRDRAAVTQCGLLPDLISHQPPCPRRAPELYRRAHRRFHRAIPFISGNPAFRPLVLQMSESAAVGATHGHTRTPALVCGLRVLVYFKVKA